MFRHLVWIPLAALLVVAIAAPCASAQSTEALLDTVQHAAFNYFWNEANASNGLIRDRSESGSPASIAAVGFGLSSICTGVDRGWITRSQAVSRVLTTLNTFWTGPQGSGTSGTIGYKGLFYHFLDMTSGQRTWTCELSTIDTALLFGGIMDARQYFSGSSTDEIQIRALADSITRRADWNWMRNYNLGILMGWTPEHGFSGYGQWSGYNEAMIMYIMALGSPTHSVPVNSWNKWISGYSWGTYYGQSYVTFPPLFGHQYSQCWLDLRHVQDAYMRNSSRNITYYVNSQRATRAARAYCMANPGGFTGYSDSLWGLTASDDPISGYLAHGAPPAQSDNGTLSPTAAASSIAFTPDICVPAIRNMYNSYPLLWGAYGFKDAFNLNPSNNPGVPWYDPDFLGIDQGPMVLMIENYRTNAIWNRFMQHADIQKGMQVAGFTSLAGTDGPVAATHALFQNAPNPFRARSTIEYRLAAGGRVRVRVFDMAGRVVASLVDAVQPAGMHAVTLDGQGLASGVYQYRLEIGGVALTRKCIRLK